MVADEAGTNATGMKAKQPRLDAAMARITKLSEQQPALMQKGDAVGAEALVFIGSEWPVDSFMGPEDKLSPRQRRGIPS